MSDFPTQLSDQEVLNRAFDATTNTLKTSGASSIPGTGATNLGKAEDAVHSSGDVGIMALTVRSDTAAATAGTTGDYQPQITDALGNTWVREYYAPAYEDNTNQVAKVEHRFSFATISSATTTTIKSGAGLVHSINIIGGTLGAITVYDNTAGSGTAICPTFTPTATLPCPAILLDEVFGTGLTIVTAAATIINVSYR